MSRSTAEIVALYYERKMQQDPEIQRKIEVRDQYNGDVVVRLPELEEMEKNAVASMLQIGLDQTAMRIASTQPVPFFAPQKPGIAKSEQAADDRRLAVLGWWDMNEMEIKDGRRARQLVGYATAPVVILPDFKRKIPRWELRDPLMTYPAPTDDPNDMTPEDCIFCYERSLKWLNYEYPEAMAQIARYRASTGQQDNPNEMFRVLEYIDADDIVLVLIGSKTSGYAQGYINGSEVVELVRAPNLAGMCTAVIPGRITLDKPMGQYDGMLGMYMQQSMLQSLAVIATKKGIFKDEWVVARPNEVPKIIQMADGLNGDVGIIQGGDIKEVPLDPSYMAPQMIDRLERYQRVQGGVPAQFGGENPTNVRTGRASDSVLSATVDFTVQEAQRILARSRQHENKRAIAVDKGYWKRPKSFYIPDNGKITRLDYTPPDLWTTDEHRVEYAHAGVDENARTVEVGQLLGLELVSKHEARMQHPMIKDPQRMHDEVITETLETAILQGIQQAAMQPGANVSDYARIMQIVAAQKPGQTLADAVLQAQQEAQQRQSTTVNPVEPGSPEAQPGLAAPGQGAEAGEVPPPTNDMSNLSQMLQSLRGSGRNPVSPMPASGAPVGTKGAF